MTPSDSPSPPPPAAAEPESSAAHGDGSGGVSRSGGEAVASVDVSENRLELALPARSDDSGARSLYIYKNAFNLIPRSVRDLGRLRTLKFFSNEINVLPPEAAGELGELECLQVKISSPAVSGLPLQKLRALKELELSRVPPRPSAFSILTEIANLKCLKRLSVCNFSIRFLPPEIGCLKKLEDLDLSFNKLKCLPDDIASLNALRSLKVTNNKLVDLPSALSALEMLENLDLSNNRLTSLQSLDLSSMRVLQNLNLQYNKLSCFQVPSWICCNMEGNRKDTASSNELNMPLVEVDVDVPIPDVEGSTCEGFSGISSTISEASSSSTRYPSARRLRKGWKRRDLLQRRARQERLNSSRKLNTENRSKAINVSMTEESSRQSIVEKEDADAPEISGKNDLKTSSVLLDGQSCIIGSGKRDDCSSITSNLVLYNKYGQEGDEENSGSLRSVSDEHEGQHLVISLAESSFNKYQKPKRHSDRVLDNPKPRKCLKPVDDSLLLSGKYNRESFCGINDHMPDGFYDAGRDRPFMTLHNYEESLSFDSREVILVDRKEDEELDAIVLAAQVLLSSLRWSHSSTKESKGSFVDNLQRALVLALFVSDCFGGSDRSFAVVRARKAVSGSNYEQPFVCTCSSGNDNDDSKASSRQVHYGVMDDFNFIDLCEKSLRFIKRRRKSNIVPIGSLRFGVCRHRALLMKYLCDRAIPPIPCELVRGYLDFMPHAWNAILVQKGDSWVRMVVDACYPTDIREETNPEYFFRYVPLTRIHAPVMSDIFISSECPFPSLSPEHEAEKTTSSVVMQCKFGNLVAAAKVRTFEAEGASDEEIKKFEHSCLGEVRILGALRKHHCIVEIYGHQLLSKWVPSTDANKRHRLLQFKIMMEYVKGGSLKRYLEKLAKEGDKHVPIQLALSIARDVASALVEVHAKHVIHRDIKSENVLIDLDSQKPDGTPVVKLCDFDQAVPLQSFSHSCCIGHHGVVPPDVCVGTPRWMAPEVLRAMHTHKQYGLEVDVWSYGCLLLELLTLQVPYANLPSAEINHLLQTSQRPSLTPELEALFFSDETAMTGSDLVLSLSEADIKIMKFLVDLFHKCTKANPADRPTAQVIYDMLCSTKCKS